jgi:hypothetical protein
MKDDDEIIGTEGMDTEAEAGAGASASDDAHG